MLGQEIANLINGEQTAGDHVARWDARDLPSGSYICRIRFAAESETSEASKVLMLLK
jgi:hypothetical protein